MLMRDRATVNRMASHAALGGCRSRAESTDGIGGRFGFRCGLSTSPLCGHAATHPFRSSKHNAPVEHMPDGLSV